MRPLGLFLRWVALLALASLLSACGMARFAYSNGEALTHFWLDRYVNFNEDQQGPVKADLARVFEWHRRSELPGYVDLMERAQQRIQRPVTETEVRADAVELRRRLLAVAEQSVPAFADLALSLRPEQIVHLEQKFASNNEDYRKDNLRGDLEHRQRERFKRSLRQAEYFFGSLSGEQERALRASSDQRPLNNELILRDRMKRQQAMLTMLRRIQNQKPSREATVEMLREYLRAAQDHFGVPELQAHYRADEEAGVRQVTQLMNNLNSAQRQHFVRTLQGWIDDFRRLSARAQR